MNLSATISIVRSIMTALLSNRRCSNTMIIFFFTMTLVSTQSSAKTLHVGDNTGWTEFDIRTAAAPDYVAWSSSKTISVGDDLVFTYPEGFHNVYLLPAKIAADSCDFSQATKVDAEDVGLNVWRATKPGNYFFACNKVMDGIGTHCSMGQRLAITVVESITTVPTAGATPLVVPVDISIPSPALAPTPLTSPSPVVVAAPPSLTPTPPPPPPPTPTPTIEPAQDGPPPSISVAPIISSPPAPPVTAPEPVASAPRPSAPSPSEGVHLSAKAWTMVLSTSAFVGLSL